MVGIAERIAWWRISAFHHLLPGVALRRNLARDKEREVELRLLPALVTPGSITIDVGANFGSYTGALLPLCRKVIAIEPHPRLFRLLRAFPSARVEVIRAIVSAAAGEMIELEVSIVGAREQDALGHVAQGPATEDVRRFPTRSIVLDQFADEPVSFVKIDVEGHEMAALDGAKEMLSRCRPIWLIESEDRHCEGAPFVLFDRMKEAGYEGFFCHDGKLQPVADFALELQNLDTVIGYTRRQDVVYVNNFIFIPQERDAAPIVAACEKLLVGS